MARLTNLKEFKKQHRGVYSRIYAEGYHDAYRELKSKGQVQLYRIEYVPVLGADRQRTR